MKLFVTIGICKVMSCRIMILYTQYCLMNVFICVSSVLVPFRTRWFHLQTSEIVFFVTITTANVRFYWTMVLHARFLPMDFLFLCQFVAESISLQTVSPCSRWFQVVQLVPGGSCSFLILVCTKRKTCSVA